MSAVGQPSTRFPHYRLVDTLPAPLLIPAASPDPATLGASLRLHVADHVAPRFLTTELLYMFWGEGSTDPPSAAQAQVMPFEQLRASLAYTLSYWPLLAGRIEANEKGWLTVQQNNAGAVWVEAAVTGLSLSDLVPAAHQKQLKDSAGSRVWSNDDVPRSMLITDRPQLRQQYGGPLLVAQATRVVQDGGVLLSVWMDHAVHDGTAYVAFVNAWAAANKAMHRGGGALTQPPFPLPVHERQLVSRCVERWQAQGGTPFDHSNDFRVGEPLTGPPPHNPTRCCSHFVHFSDEQLQTLAAALRKALQHLPPSARPAFVSRNDALLAHLWGVFNAARQVPAASDACVLHVSLSFRDRVDPPIPSTYTGSCFLPCNARVDAASASVTDARSALHFAERGAALRAQIQRLSHPPYLASLLHRMAQVEPRRYFWVAGIGAHPRDIIHTSWTSFHVYACDFGWGGAASTWLAAPANGIENAFLLSPAPLGGVDVRLAQSVEAYERMMTQGWIYDFHYE